MASDPTAAPPAPSVTVFCDCGHTEAEHGKPGCLYECCTGFRPALDALRATAQPHPDAAGKGEHVHSYYPKGEHVPSYYPTCICGATAEVIPEPPAPATASIRDKAIDAPTVDIGNGKTRPMTPDDSWERIARLEREVFGHALEFGRTK